MNTQNPIGRFMVAVGAVIEYKDSGQILLIKRNESRKWQGGEWEIVYGRMAQFETPPDALKRELKEEVGLAVSIGDVLSVWHIFRGEEPSADNELVGITFVASAHTKEVQLSPEHSEYAWVDTETALDMIQVEGIRRDIQLYQESKRHLEKPKPRVSGV